MGGYTRNEWPTPERWYSYQEQALFSSYDHASTVVALGAIGSGNKAWGGRVRASHGLAVSGTNANFLPAVGAGGQVLLARKDWTLCFYHYTLATTTNNHLISVGTTGGTRSELTAGYVSNQFHCTFQGVAYAVGTSSYTLTGDSKVWRHRCCVFKGTNFGATPLAQTYIAQVSNGVLEGSTLTTGDFLPLVESLQIAPNSVYLDEMRLWTRALSVDEIFVGYQRNLWNHLSIAFFYGFEEQIGSTIHDHSGNGNDWKTAVTATSGLAWRASPTADLGSLVVAGPAVDGRLDIRISNANGSIPIAPINGFDSLVSTYEVTLRQAMPSVLLVTVSFVPNPAQDAVVLVSGPSAPSGRTSNTRIPVTGFAALLFPIGTKGPQLFTFDLPMDGRRYTFTIRPMVPPAVDCAPQMEANGHLRFDGSAYTEVQLPTNNGLSLTQQDIRPVANTHASGLAPVGTLDDRSAHTRSSFSFSFSSPASLCGSTLILCP